MEVGFTTGENPGRKHLHAQRTGPCSGDLATPEGTHVPTSHQGAQGPQTQALHSCEDTTGYSHSAPSWLTGTYFTVSNSPESPAGFLSSFCSHILELNHGHRDPIVPPVMTAVFCTLRRSPGLCEIQTLPPVSGKLLTSGRRYCRHHIPALVCDVASVNLGNVLQLLCIVAMVANQCPINWVLF